jgi:hypothetical protein
METKFQKPTSKVRNKMAKPMDTKVHIYYAGNYVCTTHTNKYRRTAKACLEYFIECGKTEGFGFYGDIKLKTENFSDSKFKASYK